MQSLKLEASGMHAAPFKCPRKDAWHNPGKDAWQNTVVVPTTRKSSTQAGGFSSKSSTQAGGFSSTRKEQHTQEFIFMLNSQTPIPLEAASAWGAQPQAMRPRRGRVHTTRGVSTSQVSSVGMHHGTMALFYSQSASWDDFWL